jgi:DNA polymerase-1
MTKKICKTIENVKTALETCRESKIFAVDTETISLENKTIIGMSLATRKHSWYIPTKYINFFEIKDLLNDVFNDDSCIKLLHNAKFDIKVFKKIGITLSRYYDTFIIAWLVDAGKRYKFGLKTLASELLGVDMAKYKDVSPDNLEEFADYAMDDTIYTLELFNYYKPYLTKNLKKDLINIEMPCIEMIAEMEERGININLARLKSLKVKLDKDTSELLVDIIKYTEEMGYKPNVKSAKKNTDQIFNPNSPQQVKEFLHHINIPLESTGVKQLSKHKKNKWVSKLLEYRKLQKLNTSFVSNLIPNIEEHKGRLHGTFNQGGTQTGRFSSSKPNLQNLPAHDNFKYRNIFIPSDGYKLIVADYSQMESRVLAHFSKDKRMIEFFKAGHDLHSATAHGMFNLDCDVAEVKDKYPDERFQAKSINFGLAYGRGAKSLGEQIGLSERKAQKIIDLYFEQFPSVRGYIQQVQDEAKRKGYVETIFGRVRHFPDLHNLNNSGKSFYQIMGEVARRSINTKIQGSSADIMKKAMIDLYRIIKKRKDGAYILIQVHDEIVMEAPEEYAEDYRAILQNCMENAVKLRVPLTAEAVIGNTWGEAK